MDTANEKAVILIDLRKRRLRIYKETLHGLHDPKLLLLLVNPESRSLMLMSCTDADPRAHRVDWAKLNSETSYELYSTGLVRQLHNLCPEWDSALSYRCIGDFNAKHTLARFRIKDMVPVDGDNYGR